MGNAYFSLCVLILFFLTFISSNSCFASDQTNSNASSLHDWDASTKLVTTSSNAKMQLDDQKEVHDNSRPFGGRKMKGGYESAIGERSSSDNIKHVKRINNVQGGDEKKGSKYELNYSKNTKGYKQKATTTDMDSFVACADYPGPHHHPPKNN